MSRTLALIVVIVAIAACESKAPPPLVDGLAALPSPVQDVVNDAQEKTQQEPENAAHWGEFGHVLHANRLLDAAIDAYQRAGELDGDSPEWPASRAVVLLKESRLEEALTAVELALENPDSEAAAVHHLAGRLYENLGDYDAALDQYQRTAEMLSNRFEVDFAIGRVLLNLQRYAEAQPYLERARRGAPDSSQLRAALARLAGAAPSLDVDVPDASEATVDGTISLPMPYANRLRPVVRTLDGLRASAAIGMLSGSSDDAIQALRLLERGYPDQMLPDERVDLAHLRTVRGNLKGAEDTYRECLARHPETTNAWLGLADLEFMTQRVDAAATSYTEASARAQNDRQRARVAQGLGRVEASRGQFAEALLRLNEATALWPESGLIHEDLARVNADLKRYDEARQHIRRARELGHNVNPAFEQQLRAVSTP